MANKIIATHTIGADTFTVELQRQFGWRSRNTEIRICLKNGKRISRAAFDAAVHGKVDDREYGTCQICARRIGITTGVIAHHGYQRPGHGWQTASCFGAKYRPLEIACDAIAAAIDSLHGYIANCEQADARLVTEPPAELHTRDAYGHIRNTYPRPDDFNVDANEQRCTWSPGYGYEHHAKRRELTRQIGLARQDIVALTKRLADWKPATPAEVAA